VHEDRTLVVTASPPAPTWAFVTACAIAGALAVPVDAIASPVSTFVAGLIGFLGLRVWRWSGLPGLLKTEAPAGFERVVLPAASLNRIVGRSAGNWNHWRSDHARCASAAASG
jgi:hypothetical protein